MTWASTVCEECPPALAGHGAGRKPQQAVCRRVLIVGVVGAIRGPAVLVEQAEEVLGIGIVRKPGLAEEPGLPCWPPVRHRWRLGATSMSMSIPNSDQACCKAAAKSAVAGLVPNVHPVIRLNGGLVPMPPRASRRARHPGSWRSDIQRRIVLSEARHARRHEPQRAGGTTSAQFPDDQGLPVDGQAQGAPDRGCNRATRWPAQPRRIHEKADVVGLEVSRNVGFESPCPFRTPLLRARQRRSSIHSALGAETKSYRPCWKPNISAPSSRLNSMRTPSSGATPVQPRPPSSNPWAMQHHGRSPATSP